ncbi:MAG TPA: DUF2461 domain-containing protein [Actinomycetaceae bacterium]|nr:DUF2461 domain-containing protein [Actinomycetaceae bacterium]
MAHDAEQPSFPEAGALFYHELVLNNERPWWRANKTRWERDVRDPLERIMADLRPEFGEAKIFRPYRDLRYGTDKTPYKTHQGAYISTGPAAGWYAELGVKGLMTGGGFYHAAAREIAAYRAAVDDPARGHELEVILEELTSSGWEVAGDSLTTAPRGFSRDHPRIRLLRHKHLFVRRMVDPEVRGEDAAAARIAADWIEIEPLIAWVSDEFEKTALMDEQNAR